MIYIYPPSPWRWCFLLSFLSIYDQVPVHFFFVMMAPRQGVTVCRSTVWGEKGMATGLEGRARVPQLVWVCCFHYSSLVCNSPLERHVPQQGPEGARGKNCRASFGLCAVGRCWHFPCLLPVLHITSERCSDLVRFWGIGGGSDFPVFSFIVFGSLNLGPFLFIGNV